ncbi:MAG: hypothetical protein H0U31_02475 [Chloroflexia bacterium]|nr:hypothetical protein [Chloroflexia bacterium]
MRSLSASTSAILRFDPPSRKQPGEDAYAAAWEAGRSMHGEEIKIELNGVLTGEERVIPLSLQRNPATRISIFTPRE